jgi:hypothetical protein
VTTLIAGGLSQEVLAAAWLHDVAEDCAADLAERQTLLKDIEHRFGPAVSSLVSEVTSFFGPEATMEERQRRLAEHAPHLSRGRSGSSLPTAATTSPSGRLCGRDAAVSAGDRAASGRQRVDRGGNPGAGAGRGRTRISNV